MRILLVSGSAPPMRCGVGDYVDALAAALARVPGVDVGLLTGGGAAAVVRADGVERLTPVPDWRARWGWRLFGAIRQWRPDVVHLQFPGQGYRATLLPSLVPLLSWISGARAVRTWHEAIWRRQAHWRDLLATALQWPVPGPVVVVRPNFRSLIHPLLDRLLPQRRLRFIAGASAIAPSRLDAHGRAALRARLLGGQRRLVMFFGFLYPHKGVELLFDICDPARDMLVVLGGAEAGSAYSQALEARAGVAPWQDRVRFAGFQDPATVADMLAAADAVVLPFRDGAGIWNSSLHTAQAQGTFTLATSQTPTGFDPAANLFFAPIDDVAAMRAALDDHAGRRSAPAVGEDDWDRIAREHLAIYR